MRFEDVTPLFLEKFEKYIINKGLSITTVGIYVRPLRANINREIRNENYSLNNYPYTNENSYIFPLLNNSLSPFQTKEKLELSVILSMRK